MTPNPELFLDFIEYLYSLEIKFPSVDHAVSMMLCANQYGAEDLKNKAINYVVSTASNWRDSSIETMRDIYDAAECCGAIKVKEIVFSMVSRVKFFSASNASYHPDSNERKIFNLNNKK